MLFHVPVIVNPNLNAIDCPDARSAHRSQGTSTFFWELTVFVNSRPELMSSDNQYIIPFDANTNWYIII